MMACRERLRSGIPPKRVRVFIQVQTSQIKPGVTVVELTDSIKMGDDCQRLEKEVEMLIGPKETRVIFDLTGVGYLDSSAIGSIVKSLSRLKKSGGDLRLAGVKGMVDGVLKMTKVNTVIGIFPTALDASENFLPAVD